MAAEGTDQPINPGASLDLAFDWLKPVIRDQLRTAEALDNKASVMFALTTAMLAAGASFGIGNLTYDSVFAFIAGGFGLAVYFASVAAFYNSARLRNFQSLNDPRKIRSEWLSLPPDCFKQTMIEYTEEHHTTNESLLKEKSAPVKWLVRLVVLETVLLLLFLALAQLGL